jgi:hypothetical protein
MDSLGPSPVKVDAEPLSSRTWAIALAVRHRRPRVIIVVREKSQRRHCIGLVIVIDIGIRVEEAGP